MSKETEGNAKLEGSVIISVIMHIVFMLLLMWGSFKEYIEDSYDTSSDIDAIMLDSASGIGQYNYEKNQKSDNQQVEKHQQKQVKQKALQQKQSDKPQQLKVLEKEPFHLKKKVKASKERQKMTESAVKQASLERKVVKLVKIKTKDKTVLDEKDKGAAEKSISFAKEQTISDAVDESDVYDLLGRLSSFKNIPKNINVSSAEKADTQKKSSAFGTDVTVYLGQITRAIQSRFYDAELYRGKSCDLRIKLAPDGLLIDVKAEGGSVGLCQAAIAAVKQAHIPKPPSQAVYEVFKNVPLRFKPR